MHTLKKKHCVWSLNNYLHKSQSWKERKSEKKVRERKKSKRVTQSSSFDYFFKYCVFKHKQTGTFGMCYAATIGT